MNKTANGYWSPTMRRKHANQIQAHIAKFGPLGVLFRQPTQAELDKAHEEFLAEKYGPKPKPTRRSG